MALAESSILKPKHPDLKDPDDWPIFTLTNANVISQETGLPCSLLAAHRDNRVKVVGRMGEVEDEHSHLVLDAHYAGRTIQLSNVATYSFAEYPDGTYGYWAAGEAGWFELEETVPKYRPIIDDMNVATSMLYFIADKMRRSRKTDFTGAEFNKHIRRLFQDVKHEKAHCPICLLTIGIDSITPKQNSLICSWTLQMPATRLEPTVISLFPQFWKVKKVSNGMRLRYYGTSVKSFL